MPKRRDVEIADTLLPANKVEADAERAATAEPVQRDDEVEAKRMVAPPANRAEVGETMPPADEDEDGDEDGSKRGHDSGAETAPELGRWAPPPADAPPVTGWDRYELLDLLGKGGMGVVYRARDRRLGRLLAIKFILGADPSLALRLMREARAQARMEHPNVCRVYEVDEVQGRAYIALQFIDGEPLHKVAARMSLDEKIAVMRDVALAIHEAHRLGIVHRDLKPGNVLVERTEDGRWLPVVMDFGLARELATDIGLTESGIPLGTPAYMSPEQARGDVRNVDRRSDVYSLGATLYELLTGSVPFPAPSVALAIVRVLHDVPPAPRSLVPSIPVDLETIALKCLAKEPVERYASARALADDLGRYLDGEPIRGRRVPLWQRLRRRARRHRALVMLGASSLAIIIVLATLGIRERVLGAERAHLAERLGREATEIEGALREAYLWPLHDTRRDRELIRDRMIAIAGTDHGLGSFGDAIVHNALGRGHLALHEWREAADELERGARAAPELLTPELHAAHARALGELYRRALVEALRSGDKALFARRQQALAQQYLTPALAEIEAIRHAGGTPVLLDALIALYRRDFAAAETRALAVAETAPGSAEARKLAADAAYGAAIEAFGKGDYRAARTKLEAATELYAGASEVARSDPSLYEAAAQTWLQRAELDVREGRSPREALEHALEVIDHRALRAEPDDAAVYTIKAYVYLRWYRIESLRGSSDRRALLDGMASAATRAVELAPGDALARAALANAYLYRGRYEAHTGGEGLPWFTRALDEIGKARALRPDDPKVNSDLGAIHAALGTELDNAGRDPMPEYEAAESSYRRAAEIDPQYLSPCINLIDLHATIAEREDAAGHDPLAAVEKARVAGERCLAIDRSYHAVLDLMARAELALAHYRVEHERDPAEALANARSYLDRSEKILPGHMDLWFQRAVAARIAATHQLRRAEDPLAEVKTGQDALSEAQDRSSALVSVEAARLHLIAASWLARDGQPTDAVLAEADASVARALERDPQLAEAKLVAAEVCLQRALVHRSSAVIERGIAHVDQALARNPRLPGAQRVRDALVRLRGP